GKTLILVCLFSNFIRFCFYTVKINIRFDRITFQTINLRHMGSVNWLAVLVAGISSFVTGGIWYSPNLFGKAWMKENNLSEDQFKRGNKGKIFGWTLIFSLLMAANLGMFLDNT